MPFGTVELFRGRAGAVLGSIGGAWFLVLGTRLVFPALLPYVKEDFALSNAVAGAVLSLIWICYSLMQFPSGILTDHLGERILLTLSMTLAAASMVLLAAPLWILFLAGAVLYGSGTGLFGPPRITALEKTYPNRTGSALGVIFALGNLGTALLPPTAGLVALVVGWQWAFLLLAIPMLVVGVLLWRFAPGHGGSPEGPSGNLSFSDRVGDLREGLSDRSVLLAVVGLSLGIFSYQGLSSFLPFYLIQLKDVPQATASVMFGVFFAAGAFFQLASGILADRIGDRLTLVAVSLAAGLGLLWFVAARGTFHLYLVLMVLGVRMGIGPVANGYLVAIIPDRIQGTVYGMVRTICLSVGSMGSLVVGAMADADWLRGSVLLLSGLSGLMGLVYVPLRPSD